MDESGVKNEIAGYNPEELGNDEFSARSCGTRGDMRRRLVCPSDAAGCRKQGPRPRQTFSERHLCRGFFLADFAELGLVVAEEDVVGGGGDEVDEYLDEGVVGCCAV